MLYWWNEMSSPEMQRVDKQQAIVALVVGSCEQHACHLPLGTDVFLGQSILEEAAKKAKTPVYLLPTLPYGFSAHHMHFPGSITLEQSVLEKLVENIFSSVSHWGFHNLLVLNSHGGNSTALQFALNELGARYGIKLIFTRYWDHAAEYIEKWRSTGPGGIGHAGEMETSLMLHIAPHLVREKEMKPYQVATGNAWFGPDMFANNRVIMYNNFEKYSNYGNVGQGQYATKEKGEALFAYVTDQLADFLDHFWKNNAWVT